MSEDSKKNIRLSKAAIEFNIGMSTIIEFLGKKGYKLDSSPNTKLDGEMYALLVKEYHGEKEVKKNAEQLGNLSYKGKSISIESTIKDDEYEDEILREDLPETEKDLDRATVTQTIKMLLYLGYEIKKGNEIMIRVYYELIYLARE